MLFLSTKLPIKLRQLAHACQIFCVEKYRQTTGLFVHKKIKWGWKSIQSHNQLCNMYSIRIDYSWLFSNTNPLFLCKCLGVSLIRINSSQGKKKTYLTHTIIHYNNQPGHQNFHNSHQCHCIYNELNFFQSLISISQPRVSMNCS